MPTDPDLSVVIPARNEEHYIRTALESIQTQSLPLDRLEVVVVVNATSDGTAAVVRAFAATSPFRVQLIEESVAGIARAKNRGARAARGRCLLFLDADSRASRQLADRVLEQVERGYPAGSVRIVADSRDWLDRASSD